MPKEIINCDNCKAEMNLEKQGKVITKDHHNCRVRRFKCPVCDTVKTLYAGGDIDEQINPAEAVEEANNLFDSEESYEGYMCTHGLPINECILCN